MKSDDSLDTFGKRLSYLRKCQETTQQALAEAIGLARSNLTKYEQDKVKPTSDVIISIADFFHVSTDWLLRGLETQKEPSSNPVIQEMLTVLEYIMADPDPDVHAWAKIQFKKAFSEYYELLGLDKGKQRSSRSAATDENAAALHDEKSNIA